MPGESFLRLKYPPNFQTSLLAKIGLSIWTLDSLILRIELENIGFHSQIGALKSTATWTSPYVCGKDRRFSLESLGFESGLLLCIYEFLLCDMCELCLFTSLVWVVSWVLRLTSLTFGITLVPALKSKPFIMFRKLKNSYADFSHFIMTNIEKFMKSFGLLNLYFYFFTGPIFTIQKVNHLEKTKHDCGVRC